MSQRKLRVWPALLVTGALTFTAACAGDDSGSGDNGQVSIRFAWWGDDSRHRLTEEAIAVFEEKNPDIRVEPSFSAWDSYYDQISTQIAGSDAPDVFAIEIRRLGEFAGRGTLADLDGLVDTGDLNAQLLPSGNIDGVQYAIPTGANAFTLMANTAVFEQAGVDIPDDTSWTWDDYHRISAEITEATGNGTYGTQLNFNDAYLRIFADQRGEAFYTEDAIGISAETISDWFDTHLELIDTAGSPDAALSTEIGSTGVETSLVATNSGAMGMWWSNQLAAVTSGSGEDIELLRMPREPGAASSGMFLQPTMFWTASETSSEKEAAGKLIDFLANDPEAGAILGSDRGLPMNESVLEQIRDDLPETDLASLEFIDAAADDISDPPGAYPDGAGEVPNMLQRYGEQVIFGQLTSQEAAEQFLTEANSTLG
ncbi:ABC transporter substrate-binding protein [Streptomyces sp. ACA25]|uniref:ABC transporter substrate-binding protein n=1 Tax=Streptomyces sp. ACA25 TaxID=3022596 RepID=UPI002307F03C|nr:ABC transporter substrate-binding protein [Streptomyces sp. ACA25]MDB1088485.1 ABC transporter substrate-binding protein [Streptomyces sp. ACA25]